MYAHHVVSCGTHIYCCSAYLFQQVRDLSERIISEINPVLQCEPLLVVSELMCAAAVPFAIAAGPVCCSPKHLLTFPERTEENTGLMAAFPWLRSWPCFTLWVEPCLVSLLCCCFVNMHNGRAPC